MAKNSVPAVPKRVLGVFDSVALIIGVIIGVGIFEATPLIAASGGDVSTIFVLWGLGGVLSLAGALCYAELSSAYPESGGDYHYLNRAYGPSYGYLFAWSQLIVVRPGSVAALAFPSARYLDAAFGLNFNLTYLAAALVAVLTLVNIAGAKVGKWTQNGLSIAKVVGLVALFWTALFADGSGFHAPADTASSYNIGLALILILFCFGGWSEIALVASEVTNPKKNLLKSLVLGVLSVTILMIATMAVFLHLLGLEGVSRSNAVGFDAIETVAPGYGGVLMSLLIAISAIGAMQGLIFAGARVSYALGKEHRFLKALARWNPNLGAPTVALAVQGLISLAVILLAQSFTGVLVYTTSVVWVFYSLTGASVFVLRRKEPNQPRPYRVSFHPYTTALFCLSCLYLAYSALEYDWQGSAVAIGLVLVGLPVYWLEKYQS